MQRKKDLSGYAQKYPYSEVNILSMNYNEAIEYIHSTYRFGSVLGLDNINRLLEILGNPQDEVNVIHVAGTNGKGSTSSIINTE